MTARLQEKHGYYYVVFTYKDESGKRCESWFNTKLSKRGNKKEAEKLMDIAVKNFKPELLEKFKEKELDIFNPYLDLSVKVQDNLPDVKDKGKNIKRIEDESENKVLFGNYLIDWLETIKNTIEPNTYMGYKNKINHKIAPYFNKKGIALQDLTENDIQEYYNEELKRVKANTIIRYHANIRKCLEYARR